MAARDFTLTITAAAQPLSAALTDTTRGGKVDEAFRELIISADTDCQIGGSSAVTTSNYGYKILAANQQPLYIGPYDCGAVKLSDFWVIGTSGKLHILGIPY